MKYEKIGAKRMASHSYFILHISYLPRERETGLEPATNSLEGCDSTN